MEVMEQMFLYIGYFFGVLCFIWGFLEVTIRIFIRFMELTEMGKLIYAGCKVAMQDKMRVYPQKEDKDAGES